MWGRFCGSAMIVLIKIANKSISRLRNTVYPMSLKLPKDSMVVSRSIISECLKKLKKKFSRGFDGICGHYLLYCSERLLESVSLLFQIIIVRGLVPNSFCIGVVTPILKPGKPPTQYSSYSPITVSTTLSKLFELVVRNEVKSKCTVPPHQFGFQTSLGCDHALYSLVYSSR